MKRLVLVATTLAASLVAGVSQAVAADTAAPAEQRWGLMASAWGTGMASALGDFGEFVSDSSNATLLVLGHEATTIEAAVLVAGVRQCGPTFRRDVGLGPTKRTRYVSKLVLRACGKFNLAMNHFVRGVDSADPSLFVRATTALEAGTRILNRATKAVSSFN